MHLCIINVKLRLRKGTNMIEIAGHVLITLTAVIALAIRIEHRLTIIETDMKWLKRNTVTECKGVKEYEQN